jgi:3-methyladenine DNA glycosylase/8-oxoguanine DNA glycosylase
MNAETIQHLSERDPVMGRLIARVGPCGLKPDRRRSPFEALVRAVIHQQLSGKAAGTIAGRVTALFPDKSFPSPEDLPAASEEKLRGAGLSRAKTASVKDIAAHAVAGKVPDRRGMARLDDDEIVETLTEIRGVGRWTVEMLLIFTLGRPNVLPIHDLGVRKGFALTYGGKELPEPEEMLERGLLWAPCRTTAAWYLWRSLD